MSKFTKFKGKWMVATQAVRPVAGDRLTVTKRDGSSKNVIVEAPVATDANGWTLCSIRSSSSARRASSSTRSRYCGYDCPVSGRRCGPANGPCHDCM